MINSAVGWYIASKYPNRLLSWSAKSVPHMDAFINAMEHDKIQKKKSSYISFFKILFLPEIYFRIFGYENPKKYGRIAKKDEINDYMRYLDKETYSKHL